MKEKKNTPQNPALGITYSRVSTKHQDKSMEIQSEEIHRYADYRRIILQKDFGDTAVSGKKHVATRPGGQAMLSYLASHPEIGSLIILKLDRLGRSASDVMDTIEDIEKLGVVLHIVQFGGDPMSTSGPTGKLFLRIMAGVAQWERETIAERIGEAMDLKFSKNEFLGGETAPFGSDKQATGQINTRKDGTEFEIFTLIDNPIEQHWLWQMKRLRESGMRILHIAQWLNAQGARTKTGQFNWTYGKVNKVLNSKHSQRLFNTVQPISPAPAAAAAEAAPSLPSQEQVAA